MTAASEINLSKEKFGRTFECTDGQHFVTLMQSEAPCRALKVCSNPQQARAPNSFVFLRICACRIWADLESEVPLLKPCQLVPGAMPRFTDPGHRRRGRGKLTGLASSGCGCRLCHAPWPRRVQAKDAAYGKGGGREGE